METSIVTVQNMANQQDADKVLQAIEEVWGVSKAEINLSKSQATFTYDERMASQQDFEQAIKDLGFDITH
ncbi:copper chaperone [Peribacillus asahii]|uniref:Copper chaperone n=1 Tax=Peribacillus asahii TaxID=228899 RepID=A0A398B278_9BACI|nr:heavy-metal-associated domain-containing protein [Peribacillus asahii]RID83434.1 copper chaperone [Peribacillus asahii]